MILNKKKLASPEQTATGKDLSNPFMVVMTYQKSYSNQHTMIHVQSVELVISSPWIIPFLGTKGLTNPEWMATGKDTSKPFIFQWFTSHRS